jgi:undecaprenyl-diphosphatase
VIVIYRRRLWELAVHFSRTENRSYVYKLAAAVAIAVVGGFVAKQAGLELPDTVAPIAWALVLGGLAIFAIEAYAGRKPPSDVLTWKVAFWVGLSQILAAVFPGTSGPRRRFSRRCSPA